jgi:gamma-glutamyltranspeptidase/glutathione hydrolase
VPLATAHFAAKNNPKPFVAVVPGTVVSSPRGMVVSSSAEASRAGIEMLAAGGNAIDAAVATALALGVTEPGGSGLGGATFMLVRLASGATVAIDGAAVAPRSVDRGALLEMWEKNRFYGHRVAAVPGTLGALVHALERYGTKTFQETLRPAVELADAGVALSSSQRMFIDYYFWKIRDSEYLCSLFLKDCFDLFEPEHVHCVDDLAWTLHRLADAGPAEFYRGEIAARLDRDMAASGGFVRRQDLSLARPAERSPVRGSYRGFEVLSYPTPAGGAAVVGTLNILDTFPTEVMSDPVRRIHLTTDAARIALSAALPGVGSLRTADREAQDRQAARRRASAIRADRALYQREVNPTPARAWQGKNTTHVSVADAYGNVVSMTQSLGRQFGAGVATPGLGFIHNSFLEGYEFANPRHDAFVSPAKPAWAAMAPTIVLRDGKPFLLLGSSGSNSIPTILAGVVVNLVDLGASLGEAVTAARAVWSGDVEDKLFLEMVEPITPAVAEKLRALGFSNVKEVVYPPAPTDMWHFGSVNALLIDPRDSTLLGIGDPRRQGIAVGLDPVPSLPVAGTAPGTSP